MTYTAATVGAIHELPENATVVVRREQAPALRGVVGADIIRPQVRWYPTGGLPHTGLEVDGPPEHFVEISADVCYHRTIKGKGVLL